MFFLCGFFSHKSDHINLINLTVVSLTLANEWPRMGFLNLQIALFQREVHKYSPLLVFCVFLE